MPVSYTHLPGHELIYNQRVLHSWGIDGHNSHTNVCSAGARTGYAFWHGFDRPSPDHSKARFILLLSSHLEAGHYFNPHAQRIIDGKMDGAKAVSYTHLDVYKRQAISCPSSCIQRLRNFFFIFYSKYKSSGGHFPALLVQFYAHLASTCLLYTSRCV